jgi:hypothetical protein
MVCLKSTMVSESQVRLALKHSRHQRSHGDCALRSGERVASIQPLSLVYS